MPKIKSIQVDPKNWILKGTSTITSSDIINNNDFNLNIGPNPFNNKLQFIIPQDFKNVKVTIIDVTGKILSQSIYNKPQFEIDGSKLPKGVYIIRVSNDKKTSTRKLVKE